MDRISSFFIFFDIFIFVVIILAFGISFNLHKETSNFNSLNILKSEVKAIGVLDEKNYGTVTFYIYLIPKNKFFTNSSLLIDFDDVSLGNTLQDYLKNVILCLNNITHGKLKKYTVLIKAESKFKDVDGGSGSVMIALGILSALYNKTIDKTMIATGTVNPDCSIGAVLGVREKLIGVENLGFKKFYIPYNNYNLIKGINTSVKVIPVKNLKEVISGEFK